MADVHDPLRPHAHDPNPTPPSADPTIILSLPNGTQKTVIVNDLQALPRASASNCYVVSTGHGTSGPFTFDGVRLLDVVQSQLEAGLSWSQVEVISADGFGNRVLRTELTNPDPAGPILLSYALDGQAMARAEGLVRLVVPSEKDDALRQVKWVGRINVRK